MWSRRIARRHTFGLGKVAFLDAGLESFVEHGIKLVIRRDCQVLVVGLDIFLDRLTAVVVDFISQEPPEYECDRESQEKTKAPELDEIAHLLPLLSFSYEGRRVSHGF